MSAQTAPAPAAAPAAPVAAKVQCTVAASRPPTDADRAFAAGDFAKSEQLYTAELAATPAEAGEANAGIVHSQLHQQKAAEALATAQKLVLAQPTSAEAETLLGEALLRNSKILEASAAFSKGTALDRCYARAHFGSGEIFNLAAMHAAAHREFTVAHSLAPGDIEARIEWIKSLGSAERKVSLGELVNDAKADPTLLSAEQKNEFAADLALLEKGKTCHLATPVENAKIDLMPLYYDGVHVRDWGLNAKFNDHKSALLELDTSVSGIVLGRDFASKAGLENILGAQAGTSSGYMSYADTIKIGNLELKDCPVRVVDDAALANSNSLISADVFKDHIITINYANRTFMLSPLPKKPETAGAAAVAADAPQDRYAAPELKDWTRVYLADGRIMVPTGVNKTGPYLFMLDTGTVFTTLSPPLAKSVLETDADETAPIKGISGRIVKAFYKQGGLDIGTGESGGPVGSNGGADVFRTDVVGPVGQRIAVARPRKSALFQFGPYTMLDNKSYAFDIAPLSATTGVEVSGLLGFPIMKDFGLALDYRDGLVQFIFDKQHVYRTREGTYY